MRKFLVILNAMLHERLTGNHLRSPARALPFLPSWARFLNTVAAMLEKLIEYGRHAKAGRNQFVTNATVNHLMQIIDAPLLVAQRDMLDGSRLERFLHKGEIAQILFKIFSVAAIMRSYEWRFRSLSGSAIR